MKSIQKSCVEDVTGKHCNEELLMKVCIYRVFHNLMSQLFHVLLPEKCHARIVALFNGYGAMDI
jgi:hypothetical protein